MTNAARYAPRLDDKLIETDALLRKWADMERERSPLHPLEKIRLLRDGAVLGGGDAPVPEEIMILDEILSSSPKETRAFVIVWYCDRSPVIIKANRLGISRAQIYIDLKENLQYIRGRLHERGVRV